MSQRTILFCISSPLETVMMMPLYRVLATQGHRVLVLQAAGIDSPVQPLQEWFGMPSDATLGMPEPDNGKLFAPAMLDAMQAAFIELQPDAVMVAGGSSIALAGTLSAYAQGIPVAHIDAGLRSYADIPSASEKNQELIARLAHWHFTATEQARCNLLEERIAPSRIFEVGSTLVDAALWAREYLHASATGKPYSMPEDLREFLFRCRSRRLILLATENLATSGQTVLSLAQALVASIENHPESLAIWQTEGALAEEVQAALDSLCPTGHPRIWPTCSLSYPASIDLLSRCSFVLTDTESIEQQASAFGKPVLFAGPHDGHRDLLTAGGARLTGLEAAAISHHLEMLLRDAATLLAMQMPTSPFGDGAAAERITNILSIVD